MRAYWSETRPNGQPVEPGTFCFITDLEDGTHPIATYGKTQDEVTQKLAHQNAHAQLAIARRTQRVTDTPRREDPPPSPPKQPSADDVMQATADLQDPARAVDAVATLLHSATGVDPRLQATREFARMAVEWEQATPEFLPHPANKHLLAQRAQRLAGGKLAAVTPAIMTRAFEMLLNEGVLVEDQRVNDEPANPPAFPAQTQVQRTERTPKLFATGARSARFGTHTPQRVTTLKYTEEQIRTMPLEKSKALVMSNDPDYAKACAYYFASARPQPERR